MEGVDLTQVEALAKKLHKNSGMTEYVASKLNFNLEVQLYQRILTEQLVSQYKPEQRILFRMFMESAISTETAIPLNDTEIGNATKLLEGGYIKISQDGTVTGQPYLYHLTEGGVLFAFEEAEKFVDDVNSYHERRAKELGIFKNFAADRITDQPQK